MAEYGNSRLIAEALEEDKLCVSQIPLEKLDKFRVNQIPLEKLDKFCVNQVPLEKLDKFCVLSSKNILIAAKITNPQSVVSSH